MRPVILYADGPDGPRSSPAEVAVAAGLPAADLEVLMGWTLERHAWLSDPHLRGRTTMAGYGLRQPVADGRLLSIPIRLSAVPALIDQLKPEVYVVTGVRRGSGFAFGSTIGWGPAAARSAVRVVVEVDEDAFDYGGPLIPGNIVAAIARPPAAPGREVVSRPADDIDLRIGVSVASLLPPEPTVQFGPGGIVDGIARAIDAPVRVWSGLVTDAVAELAARGLLRGRVTAGYVWGGPPVQRLSTAGLLDRQPIEVTHDITQISGIDRFVGCNTAVQVGLDGSINVERVGGRTISSIGGHADFCAGAVRSRGGLSVIAVRSTTAAGASAIVSQVEVVSTPRCDVSVVVTEHGIADLRGIDDAERSRRLVAIAAPEHREVLSGR